jgi:hypothetical protein
VLGKEIPKELIIDSTLKKSQGVPDSQTNEKMAAKKQKDEKNSCTSITATKDFYGIK